MVTGFTKFKEKFQGFEDQYVVIGGTACNLLMENEDMAFRATKDIDGGGYDHRLESIQRRTCFYHDGHEVEYGAQSTEAI